MKLLSELKLFWFTFDDNMRRAPYNHLPKVPILPSFWPLTPERKVGLP